MTLAVIGAGFGRTGTNSMKLALGMLGVGPCHHMSVLLDDPDHAALWREIARGGPPDWDMTFAGFRSAVDWPSSYYWQDLAQYYPQAKILLTLRSEESWWESYSSTVANHLARQRGGGSWGDQIIAARIMGGKPDDRATCVAAYNANTAAVRASVPPDRLIVHELGDGWGPLCAGLDLPVPQEAYPNTNSSADFVKRHAERDAAPEQGKS